MSLCDVNEYSKQELGIHIFFWIYGNWSVSHLVSAGIVQVLCDCSVWRAVDHEPVVASIDHEPVVVFVGSVCNTVFLGELIKLTKTANEPKIF